MSNLARDISALPHAQDGDRLAEISNVPRVTIDAFCETAEVGAAIEAASRDRRLAKARVSVRKGGIASAVNSYANLVTPDLIVIESRHGGDDLLARLDELATLCVASTKLIVIGHSNDIALYRALLDKGVSDYLLAPIDELTFMAAVSRLYRGPGADSLGKVLAFVGAKGGAGSSTVAHNVAWSIGRSLGSSVLLADLDLPFGTAGLDFNLEQSAGVSEALQDVEGLDELKLDRITAKHDDHLSLLSAPAELAGAYDFEEGTFDRIVDIARASTPFLVLDIPHLWTAWAKKLLLGADEVVITAEPDLASFRNAKSMVELLHEARPNDLPPRLILNQVGMPKRPEIQAEEFSSALKLEPLASIPFDPQLFGTAANNGQMIGAASAKHRTAGAFADIARVVTGRMPTTQTRRRGSGLARLWQR